MISEEDINFIKELKVITENHYTACKDLGLSKNIDPQDIMDLTLATFLGALLGSGDSREYIESILDELTGLPNMH